MYLHHLESLQPGEWVNGEAINCFMRVLSINARHICFGANPQLIHSVWMTDTWFYDKLTGVERNEVGRVSQIKGYDINNVIRFVRKADLRGIQTVIIPINLSNTHWISVVVDVKTCSIEVADSLHRTHPTVISNISRWVSDTFGIETALTAQQSIIPRQTEDDCGVFCCARTTHAALNLKAVKSLETL